MNPAIHRMRSDVCSVYDFTPSWVKRVDNMPVDQLTAIWYRFKSLNFDPKAIRSRAKESKKAWAEELPEHVGTTYYCGDCRGAFVADNPDLNECRFCGSYKLERM